MGTTLAAWLLLSNIRKPISMKAFKINNGYKKPSKLLSYYNSQLGPTLAAWLLLSNIRKPISIKSLQNK